MIANLHAALAIQEAEVSQVGNDEKSREEMTRKDKVSEKVYQKAWKANDDPSCGITQLFDWAEDIDTSIGPIDVVHNRPTPFANVNMSSDTFPIARSATAGLVDSEGSEAVVDVWCCLA